MTLILQLKGTRQAFFGGKEFIPHNNENENSFHPDLKPVVADSTTLAVKYAVTSNTRVQHVQIGNDRADTIDCLPLSEPVGPLSPYFSLPTCVRNSIFDYREFPGIKIFLSYKK